LEIIDIDVVCKSRHHVNPGFIYVNCGTAFTYVNPVKDPKTSFTYVNPVKDPKKSYINPVKDPKITFTYIRLLSSILALS
jgi:hypothetical protein